VSPARRRSADSRAGRGRRTLSARELEHYRGDIRSVYREDGVVCLECGGLYGTLLNHVAVAHHMAGDDYREKWGYNRQTRFAAPDTASRMRARALKHGFGRGPGGGSAERLAMARALRPPPGTAPHRREARVGASERLGARYAAGWQPTRHPKAEALVRALAAGGLSPSQIATQAGLAPSTVGRRLKALGVRFSATRSAARDEAIRALRQQGLWTSAIVARLGLSQTTVDRRLRALQARGVAVPRPHGPRPNAARKVTDDQIVAAAREGLRPFQIQARFGVAQSVLARRLSELRKRSRLPFPEKRRIDEKAVAQLTRRGWTPARIAERLGVEAKRVSWVLARLRRQGRVRKSTRPDVREPDRRPDVRERDRRLAELSAAGLWPAQIAERLGLHASFVASRLWKLRRKGLAAPPAGRRPAHNRKVTDEQLVAFTSDGLRGSEIATRVGMHPMAVWTRLRALRRRGVITAPPPPRPPKAQKVSDEAILTLARRGLPTRAIARRTGVATITVSRRIRSLRAQGVLPPRPALTERQRRILALAQAGLPPPRIAARLRMPVTAVRPALSKLRARGIEVPYVRGPYAGGS
jgi:transposase